MESITAPKMSEVLDTSRFALPVGALISTFAADLSAVSRSQLLDKVRKNIRRGRKDQHEWARAFDELYQEALRSDFSAPSLMRWSAALLERQRAALERLYPFLEDIQRQLTALKQADPELLKLYQEIIDFIFGWVTPYQKLSGQLLDLALVRRSERSRPLRAKPVAAGIDYAELTRDTMAKFPKILAALAK